MATTAKIEVKDQNPVGALQDFLKKLLNDEEVGAVLVPKHLQAKGTVMPTLITKPEEMDSADPLAPSFPLNAAKLVAKLTRGAAGEKVAAVLRPCEIRAFIELVKLNQGSLEEVLIVGVDCYGTMDNSTYRRFIANGGGLESTQKFIAAAAQGQSPGDGLEIAKACKACEHPVAEAADLMIGLFGVDLNNTILLRAHSPRGEALITRLGLTETGEHEGRKKALDDIVKQRTEFRDKMFEETKEATSTMEKLADYLSGCVNCYNCRVACPVCYCKECVFVTDVFDHKPWQYLGWAKQRGAIRMPTDTVFYHLTRLAHMSTACVGCGQCSNACPNDIPVMELFRTVGASTQAAFDYEAGRDPLDAPPLSVFQEREFPEIVGLD